MYGGKARERKRAQELRARGLSINQITRQLGVAKSSVSLWVRSVELTKDQQQRLWRREQRGGAKGRRKISANWQEYRKKHPKPKPKGPRWPKRSVETFFDTWTPEMAYILGYFAADGCMYHNARGSHYVCFYSTDRELIETVVRIMGVANSIEQYRQGKESDDWKTKYTIQIGSKRLYQRLVDLGFTPNKSLTMIFPRVPDDMLGHFTRGYFDGDGCIFVGEYARKNRPGKKRIFRSTFTSGSKGFLVDLRKSLNQQGGIGLGSLHAKRDGGFSLSYSQGDTRQLFKFMYPTPTVPCLERKRIKFEEGMKSLNKNQQMVP